MSHSSTEREAFAARYMERSGIEERTIKGEVLSFAGYERLALPCACGEDVCEGWAMVNPADRDEHLRQLREPISRVMRYPGA